MDLGEDCIKVSIDRAVKKAGAGEFKWKVLPIFKSSVHKHEEMMFYSEYTSAVLYDFEDPDINPYTISEFSSNGEIITQLEKKIRALKNTKQAAEIKDFMKLKDLSDVSILLSKTMIMVRNLHLQSKGSTYISWNLVKAPLNKFQKEYAITINRLTLFSYLYSLLFCYFYPIFFRLF